MDRLVTRLTAASQLAAVAETVEPAQAAAELASYQALRTDWRRVRQGILAWFNDIALAHEWVGERPGHADCALFRGDLTTHAPAEVAKTLQRLCQGHRWWVANPRPWRGFEPEFVTARQWRVGNRTVLQQGFRLNLLAASGPVGFAHFVVQASVPTYDARETTALLEQQVRVRLSCIELVVAPTRRRHGLARLMLHSMAEWLLDELLLLDQYFTGNTALLLLPAIPVVVTVAGDATTPAHERLAQILLLRLRDDASHEAFHALEVQFGFDTQ